MKRDLIASSQLFNLLILSLMLGVSSVALAQGQSPNVWLKVADSGTELEVWVDNDMDTCTAEEKGSDNSAAAGYMCITKGNNALINMHLPPAYPCGDEEGAKWQISQVVIGGEGSTTKPVGMEPWGEISGGARDDLDAHIDTGVVNITPAGGGFSVHFNNQNEHEIVFWYRVDAVCKKGDTTFPDVGIISLDPRGRNGGN